MLSQKLSFECFFKMCRVRNVIKSDWRETICSQGVAAAVGVPGRTRVDERRTERNNNNNNNNNSYDNVYGALIMTKVIARVHPVHLMNVD